MSQSSGKEKSIADLNHLLENLSPTERHLFLLRFASQQKYGTGKQVDILIRLIGEEEAARLSIEEFPERLDQFRNEDRPSLLKI